MTIHRWFAGAALALAFALPSQAATDAELHGQLEAYADAFAATGLFSGVVLVERGGHPVFAKAYGLADRAFGVANRMDTRFQIASLSKPITSAAIGRLVDQGKLTFETPVGKIIPGIPNGDRITIEQLLTHYSGLDSPDRTADYGTWRRFPTTAEGLVVRVKASKPRFEPGEKYSYANANYWVLARVIEVLSGVSYGDFVQREIFDPLGMTHTAHRDDLLKVVPELATGYQIDGLNTYRVGEIVDWTTKTGNGSLYSTVGDLAKFYHALRDGRLLTPQTTARVLGDGKRWGLGWFHRGPEAFGHGSVRFNGRSPGYSSYLEGFKDDDVTIVMVSNLYDYAPTVVAEGLAAIVWDRPHEPPQKIILYPASPQALARYDGVYQFGPDFHVRNGKATLAVAGDHVRMTWDAGGVVSPLFPVGPGKFFDPAFWADIEIIDGPSGPTMKYHSFGFPTVFEARKLKEADAVAGTAPAS
jgi:CubicO group peptidase (beta-lactamase class C family)